MKAATWSDTTRMSVIWLNNETDVIHPKEIAQPTYEADALFMTDATQAVGKLPILQVIMLRLNHPTMEK